MTASTRRRPQFHPLRVAKVERLTDDAVAVTFDVPPELAEDYSFRPGQALTLRRVDGDRDERRSYSICAPVGAAPRVGVREVPGGFFSAYLVNEVRPGDEIEVLPPSGTFTADLSVPGDHVFVVAGSGVTPVLSLAATVLRDGESTVTVFYGNRRTNTVMFADELADLKDRYGTRLQLVHVLSREPRDADLTSGRLDGDRLRTLVDAFTDAQHVDHWWLCGPHGMVTDARELLTELGVPTERVHQELFYVDDLPPEPVRGDDQTVEGPSSSVTIVLDGRTTTLTLPRGVPVLDSAQQVRGDLPFACKGGVCGTCRARVTDGEVEMRRNYALDPGEVDAGYVLTCQSLPLTDEVTVDYDA
ncbi:MULTISPECIES: 1,2-phenylacetyl-CoA epoxidase subunit PaaE [unclassified Modestobacter]|uniref:1,2-phenylacetyl-CoA epoxidase subunit PaaE n=1 Tax=unclassified Modestobacter TaxID=2643866 RepID=UPI0022AB37F1|nr:MULTISPECIES: 1,2-phenylacetyl-CoA epoxidase subunit PaaE [unclassified Modestobacter]MCZ2826257.1 phenylacetate-CoA oxygenase/reductase subunit PaaK [Modestobacter sp. VKM Ac-2981]MCZ2852678.1 phenylacetate-CoA oxygenase/reductase subunit PaaK [Modestobacter sp. VKM Ac-2982]